MPKFVESLETRQLLSGVTLALAGEQLALDLGTLVSDAGSARTTLVADAKAFAADVKALGVKSGPLKARLGAAVASARSTLQADVVKIFVAGFDDGKSIASDVLHLTLLNTGKPAQIALYQKRLAAGIKTLETVESPYVTKLEGDVSSASTHIGDAAQAIISANPSDTALNTDYMALSSDYHTAGKTLTTDLTNVISDLETLSTAS